MTRPSFSIGIEEEYQTVDPVTFDLRSHIQTELMAQGKRVMKEKVKSEMHQAVVEVGTGVCRDMTEARVDLVGLRRQMVSLAHEHGLELVAGATHPFADWRVVQVMVFADRGETGQCHLGIGGSSQGEIEVGVEPVRDLVHPGPPRDPVVAVALGAPTQGTLEDVRVGVGQPGKHDPAQLDVLGLPGGAGLDRHKPALVDDQTHATGQP